MDNCNSSNRKLVLIKYKRIFIKNYITPEGFKKLQDELNHLIKIERPGIVKVVSWAAGNGDRSENGDYIYGKKKLRQIDSRIKYLIINIEDAEIVRRDIVVPEKQIFFGAFVVINDDIKSKLLTIRIVGAQEINHAPENISWISPLAKSLMGRSVGDIVNVETTKDERSYSVLEVYY
jgi:transcription elongation factor GreB